MKRTQATRPNQTKKNQSSDFGGGREAAEKPSAEGSTFVVGVLWCSRKQRAEGLLIQEGFPLAKEQHLVPWAVLPGRLRQELIDIGKYAGFRWPKAPEPMAGTQLSLWDEDVDRFPPDEDPFPEGR